MAEVHNETGRKSHVDSARPMNDPAASSGVSSSLLGRHSVLDLACLALDTGESSRVFWIPAFAGMTNSRQAAGNAPEGIQASDLNLFYPVEESEEFSFF